ncbi:MAG: PAS-domain containing protein [Pseudomonadota bacterium]
MAIFFGISAALICSYFILAGNGRACAPTWKSLTSMYVLPRSVGSFAKRRQYQAEAELSTLRLMHGTAPHPAWHIDPAGHISWQNQAYDRLVTDVEKAAKHLQDISKDPGRHRVTWSAPDGTNHCYTVDVNSAGRYTTCHATCITSQVNAEEALRNLVQTLTKTFAHLSTGLAIFNRAGQLSLFNPALLDLTGLSPTFLSAKPHLRSFFDALRENRRMPEPKHYQNWRQQISRVIKDAADGQYQETWTLEDGRTYSVSGRPHPDGATAFLIKDISDEIALTRHLRAETALHQQILDKMDQGIAVFSATGVLLLSNIAYRRLWKHDPDTALASVTLRDCLTLWKAQLSTPEALATLQNDPVADNWSCELSLKRGLTVTCRIEELGDNAMIARFHQHPVLEHPVLETSNPATAFRV